MNLYDQGLLDAPIGLAAALLIGLLFGFWLERSGFGSSRKLTAIFYLTDFAVLKVMFSAMATAALGLQGLGALGLVDLSRLFVPDTILWAQAVGGVVFGVGFVVGGWCPGTAAVGVGSGRLDALVFLLGAGAGSLLFAAAAPALAGLRGAGDLGVCSMPELVGLTPVGGALALAAVALVAFAVAHVIESRMQNRMMVER
jgi:uncharacterized membrane protein YedE/YeeE